MKIIMVCGVIGSGKDYFLEQYKKEHPDEEVVEIKFAEPLKAIISNMYSIDVSDKSKYEEWKNKPENRLLLQNLAEGIKENLSQTIFAKKAVDRMNEYVFSCYNREFIKLPTFIISDFRYKEELDVVFNYINYTLCSICTYELYV
jgi:tRNA uridine 5-carbamoylmethylation protein Kti12